MLASEILQNSVEVPRLMIAKVYMKYGTEVFTKGKWWWEIPLRGAPRSQRSEILGFEVRFVSNAASYPRLVRRAKDLLDRISLHTDRDDITPDEGLLR